MTIIVATSIRVSIMWLQFSSLDIRFSVATLAMMAGRPPKPESERRTNILRIRMTDQERELIDAVASANDEDTSSWAREWLIALAEADRSGMLSSKDRGA
jgi:hypothetical protein